MSGEIIPVAVIQKKIYWVRGRTVILDSDLAAFFGVTTKVLNQAVKRNLRRFPPDFMLRLNAKEGSALRSQIVTLKKGRGRHRKYLPCAFTEHGAIMVATILNSKRAVEASIYVVRAFIDLREVIASHKELSRKIGAMERRYDIQFTVIFNELRRLKAPPRRKKRPIGFRP